MINPHGISGLSRAMRASFSSKRAIAERAGDVWQLSLDEYAQVWGVQWAGRINRSLQLMRIDKALPYELGNVRIVAVFSDRTHSKAREDNLKRARAEVDAQCDRK